MAALINSSLIKRGQKHDYYCALINSFLIKLGQNIVHKWPFQDCNQLEQTEVIIHTQLRWMLKHAEWTFKKYHFPPLIFIYYLLRIQPRRREREYHGRFRASLVPRSAWCIVAGTSNGHDNTADSGALYRSLVGLRNGYRVASVLWYLIASCSWFLNGYQQRNQR